MVVRPLNSFSTAFNCNISRLQLMLSNSRLFFKGLVSFEAKKRYGTCILDYMVTSNHIHLLLYDIGDRECIPKTIQLIAGRTGQEFNQRKRRKGAFWEDRYHATAVESGEHIVQCIVYIDLHPVK